MSASFLYRGVVTHRRLRPVPHALRYRVFQVLLDLDEAPKIAAGLRLFGFNRPAPVSFYERDHGDGSAGGLKAQIEALAAAAGYETGGPVRVLCFPRVFGFVFNPISVFYCHSPNGRLSALVYEVNNTFGDRVAYAAPGERRHSLDKAMHVSPFMDMSHSYHFAVSNPAQDLRFAIQVKRGDELWLSAALTARRRSLTDKDLLAVLIGVPFMTLKVVGAIHLEAAKLWFKGVRYRPKPHGSVRIGGAG